MSGADWRRIGVLQRLRGSFGLNVEHLPGVSLYIAVVVSINTATRCGKTIQAWVLLHGCFASTRPQRPIARVHPADLMNADSVPDGRQPSDQADLGCEFAENWLLPPTFTIAVCYYY